MAEYVQPRVFTIAPGVPFLPGVASALCEGRLVEGFRFTGDPLQLSAVTIYVPTRRAARELRSAFLDHLGGETVMLPRVKPLGEFDDNADLFEGDGAAAITIPPAIDRGERLLLLGALIGQWTRHLTIDVGSLYGDEDIRTPVSTADAFWLARDLADLMDQFSTGRVAVSDLSALDTSELSEWWKVTLAFLEIMRREWPDILASRNAIDAGEHRNRRLLAEAERLKRNPPPGPVVVAGSTGTIPATAELIAAIARLPMGAVVLPGFDRDMDDASREMLASRDDIASVVGHPQYGLHQLVGRIGISHDAIVPLRSVADAGLEARRLWVAEALRPSGTTHLWSKTREALADTAFEGVALLQAPNEHLEAAAIAAALREAIHEPKATAALVTPDRDLARRVVAELARYGIAATDTGGTPLASTLQGKLLTLVLDVVFGAGDPATLLALLKHPFVRMSALANEHRHWVDLFEVAILRGGTGRIDPGNLADFAAARLVEDERRNPRLTRRLNALSVDEVEGLIAFSRRIEAALEPLCSLRRRSGQVPFPALVGATVEVLETVCRDENRLHRDIYDDENGAVLRAFLSGLMATDVSLSMSAGDWPQAVSALAADVAVKPAPGGHPRISIWGALEARLQTVDLIVMGGLNEGTWPGQTRNDQFLTRGMKAGLGLEPPERRIGLSAHDFQMAMGQRRVILSRSERAEGAPSIASRWLQRMTTYAGEEATRRMQAEGHRYVQIARLLEEGRPTDFAPRPCPAPPLTARPDSISVTEVETLIRDPYAVYAKRVLKLEPLEDLVRDPAAAERGSLFHAIFEALVRERIDPLAPDAPARMVDVAKTLFAEEDYPADIQAVWWPRIEAGVKGIAAWEAGRAAGVRTRLAEADARPTEVATTGVRLRGRADRLDILDGGTVDIIDFKTGSQPSAKAVQALLSPQLPLEGALLRRSAFAEAGAIGISGMLYVKVGSKGDVEAKDVLKGSKEAGDADPEALSEEAWEKLTRMLAYYGKPANGYLSRRMPQKMRGRAGDYDHLARFHEWSAGDGDGDE
ncbi:double-strand break repair protein AddB [Oricola cellulosilytica]|uniref:Double-strand break repair protein AddB n=1 Tax=Oricola cellulosilytica TaxID=1429082 RepID=A0A4R0PE13_9HYPH|nr:double-strand break repair protein AddB [Oricola cellulosilytica]TCD16026.1 double-strand break repair protein AddB [Oricola cellulosilytica]